MPSRPAILTPAQRKSVEEWRERGEVIVFTNGVFDLLHRGHLDYLEEARGLGDRLVVGVNDDASVARLKGIGRPIVPAEERAALLESLECVDLAPIFHDDTPLGLIEEVAPHVLVKGGDWPVENIVGRELVLERGGRVLNVPLRHGQSTSRIVARAAEGRSALDD